MERTTKYLLKSEKLSAVWLNSFRSERARMEVRAAVRDEEGFILSAVLWHKDKSQSVQHWLKETLIWFLLKRCLNQSTEQKCGETRRALFCHHKWTHVSVTAFNAPLRYHPDPEKLLIHPQILTSTRKTCSKWKFISTCALHVTFNSKTLRSV